MRQIKAGRAGEGLRLFQLEWSCPLVCAIRDSGDEIMNVDNAVMAFAGGMVLVSVALAYFVSQWWLLLTVFAGLNLMQAALTGWCPAATVFKRIGCASGTAFK